MNKASTPLHCTCACWLCDSTKQLLRIPARPDLALVLVELAQCLKHDDQLGNGEFLRCATRWSADRQKANDAVPIIRHRLGLEDAPWAYAFVLHVAAYAHCGAVDHVVFWRPMPTGAVDDVVLDPAWRVGSELVSADEFDLGNVEGERQQLSPKAATRIAGNAAELGRHIHDARRGRELWSKLGYPAGRQPSATLRRDTYLFYLVTWVGLSRTAAAARGEHSKHDRGMNPRPSRGYSRNASVRAKLYRRPLSREAVRQAVRRIAGILSGTPPLD